MIKKQIEFLDPSSKFKIDKWKRDDGGGGLTMAIKNGDVFEKGGVNISKVFGVLPDSIYKTLNVEPSEFYACGISLILHPKNPMVPTFHANLRYFELYENGKVTDKWFGGGVDLTPYYIFENDISMFHQYLKTICDNFDPNCYQKFKRNCDEYFWNNVPEKIFPTITLERKRTYTIGIDVAGFPIRLESDSTTLYSQGITHNDGTTDTTGATAVTDKSSGTWTWIVDENSPDTLYYRSTNHTDISGIINIIDENLITYQWIRVDGSAETNIGTNNNQYTIVFFKNV